MELIVGETYNIINVKGWEGHTFELKGVDGGCIRGIHVYANGIVAHTRNFCSVSQAETFLEPVKGPRDNIPEIW